MKNSGNRIGPACAEAFAQAGAQVIMSDIRNPEERAAALAGRGLKAVPYCCDVSGTPAVKEMMDWIVAAYGRLELHAL